MVFFFTCCVYFLILTYDGNTETSLTKRQQNRGPRVKRTPIDFSLRWAAAEGKKAVQTLLHGTTKLPRGHGIFKAYVKQGGLKQAIEDLDSIRMINVHSTGRINGARTIRGEVGDRDIFLLSYGDGGGTVLEINKRMISGKAIKPSIHSITYMD